MGRTRSISHAFQQNRLDPQIQEGLQEFKVVLSVLTSHIFAPAWLDLWLQLFVKPVKILWSTSVTWGWCSYSTSSGGDCAHSSDPDTGSSWPQFPWTTKSNSYFLISVLKWKILKVIFLFSYSFSAEHSLVPAGIPLQSHICADINRFPNISTYLKSFALRL